MRDSTATTGTARPVISVIVPTYKRPRQLLSCLTALAAVDYPRASFEVIVVDDGSPNPPHGLVAAFEQGLCLRVVTQPHAGPATARNTGAEIARGDFIAFTDDDCEADAGWLRVLESYLVAEPGTGVGGRTVNALAHDIFSAASQSLIDYLYKYYNKWATEGEARFFTTNNLAFPADRFRAIGGFDTSFPLAAGEDRDICDRWRAHGFPLVYAQEAVVRHSHAMTFRSFSRQHFNYGRGAYYLHRARARRGEKKVRLEPINFYTDLIRYPLAFNRGPRGAMLSLLKVVSQAAYGAGYYWERLVNQGTADR
ncbi:MAG: glycosyltransferase family 2 protein [Gemmatimonadaceae bacterium]